MTASLQLINFGLVLFYGAAHEACLRQRRIVERKRELRNIVMKYKYIVLAVCKLSRCQRGCRGAHDIVV